MIILLLLLVPSIVLIYSDYVLILHGRYKCLWVDRLVSLDVNKNDVIQLGQNDVTQGEAKSTGMPTKHKVNKAE